MESNKHNGVKLRLILSIAKMKFTFALSNQLALSVGNERHTQTRPVLTWAPLFQGGVLTIPTQDWSLKYSCHLFTDCLILSVTVK